MTLRLTFHASSMRSTTLVDSTPRSATSARRNMRTTTPSSLSKPPPEPVHHQGRTPVRCPLMTQSGHGPRPGSVGSWPTTSLIVGNSFEPSFGFGRDSMDDIASRLDTSNCPCGLTRKRYKFEEFPLAHRGH